MLSVIEALVRVGGSLLDGEHLPALCQEVGRLAARHPLLVVPRRRSFCRHSSVSGPAVFAGKDGNPLDGDFGDGSVRLFIERVDSQQLATRCATWTVRDRRWRPVASRSCCPLRCSTRPIRLPHSWQVTSDSIAAWLAREAQIPRLVLLKDVDGLYDSDPSVDPQGELLATITLDELARCEGVDANLPSLLAGSDLELWVLNGNEPGRLAELLAGGQPRGTRYHGARI